MLLGSLLTGKGTSRTGEGISRLMKALLEEVRIFNATLSKFLESFREFKKFYVS